MTCTASDGRNTNTATFVVTVHFPIEEYTQKVTACKSAATTSGAALRSALSQLGEAFKAHSSAACKPLLTAQNALVPFKKAEKDMDELLTKIKGLYKC